MISLLCMVYYLVWYMCMYVWYMWGVHKMNRPMGEWVSSFSTIIHNGRNLRRLNRINDRKRQPSQLMNGTLKHQFCSPWLYSSINSKLVPHSDSSLLFDVIMFMLLFCILFLEFSVDSTYWDVELTPPQTGIFAGCVETGAWFKLRGLS